MEVYNVSISSLLPHAPSNDGVRNSTNSWNNKTLGIVADNDIAVYVIGSVMTTGLSVSYIVYPTEAFSTHFAVASFTPNYQYL